MFKYIPLIFRVNKPLSQFFDIFKEIFRALLFIGSHNSYLYVKEFLWCGIVFGVLCRFLYFKPDVVDVFGNFASDLAFLFLFVVVVSYTEKERFWGLLFELRNTDL